jgi:PAS domain S-box-containing protein
VTEQRRAERELRASEARKGAVLETALDAIITMDHEGRVVEFNPAAERAFGFRREALIGEELAEFIIPPSLRERHRRGMAHYLTTGVGPVLGHRLELPALRADGTEFPVELAITRISHDGPPLFTAYLRDITERKRAERQRDARLAVTHALAEAATADDGAAGVLEAVCDNLGWDVGFLWIVNEDGSALACRTSWHRPDVPATEFERASCGRTFASGEGLPGRVWATGKPAWLLDVAADANFPRVAPAAEEGLHSAFACPILIGERPLGVIEFYARRTEPPDPGLLEMMGTVAGAVGQFLERRRAEADLRAAKEEAEAANQAKTQFLAVLSHELRTPLNPILLAASSMLERPTEPGEIRPTLEMIRQNVNLQARLIDDLLDVMRIVRGKMPLHWEVADGHRLIDQAVQVCRSEVLGKRLRLASDLAADQRHINADPARLQQVFWNLIKNAVKFTPEGGSIAVRTRNEPGDEGDRLVIEVSDTGIGIEPEVLPRIFDPFQQGETTITRKFGGLGLGLAICKGIVEAHGGTIVAESAGPGRGATFRVALKALPEPATERSDESPDGKADADTARPTSLRILVVEDEPTTLRLMARLLRGLGHEVETAGTIASGLVAVEGGRFDLIVSDIGLPDGSGLELMRRVVARRGPVPGIALTGYGMEEDIRRSREAGFTAHLTKPIDFAKLEAMIRQVAPTGS